MRRLTVRLRRAAAEAGGLVEIDDEVGFASNAALDAGETGVSRIGR